MDMRTRWKSVGEGVDRLLLSSQLLLPAQLPAVEKSLFCPLLLHWETVTVLHFGKTFTTLLLLNTRQYLSIASTQRSFFLLLGQEKCCFMAKYLFFISTFFVLAERSVSNMMTHACKSFGWMKPPPVFFYCS